MRKEMKVENKKQVETVSTASSQEEDDDDADEDDNTAEMFPFFIFVLEQSDSFFCWKINHHISWMNKRGSFFIAII